MFCVGKDVGQLGLSHIASESVKWYNHFTRGVTISYKSKHVTVLNPAIPLLSISQKKKNENLCLHRDSYTNIHNSFVYNDQSLKTPKCPSLGEGINKS